MTTPSQSTSLDGGPSPASASQPASARVWLRSVGAVIAGFLATAIASTATDAVLHATQVFPPMTTRMGDGLFVLAAVYRALYAVLGGWVTARLAPRNPMRHAQVLAALGTLGGIGGILVWTRGGPEMGPLWYPVAILLSAVPCVLAGAVLARRAGAGTALPRR